MLCVLQLLIHLGSFNGFPLKHFRLLCLSLFCSLFGSQEKVWRFCTSQGRSFLASLKLTLDHVPRAHFWMSRPKLCLIFGLALFQSYMYVGGLFVSLVRFLFFIVIIYFPSITTIKFCRQTASLSSPLHLLWPKNGNNSARMLSVKCRIKTVVASSGCGMWVSVTRTLY